MFESFLITKECKNKAKKEASPLLSVYYVITAKE